MKPLRDGRWKLSVQDGGPRVIYRAAVFFVLLGLWLAGCSSSGGDEEGPTIRLELDWIVFQGSGNNALAPLQSLVDEIVAEFKAQGITLEVDISNGVEHPTGVVELGPSTDINGFFADSTEFGRIRAANKDHGDDWIYGLLAWQYKFADEAQPSLSSGLAELPGRNFITGAVAFTDLNKGVVFKGLERNTIMHEFGHTLGLRHGGADHDNYKPTFNSIMNYRYQFDGVDEDCDSWGEGRGGTSGGRASYSSGKNISIDESAIEEAKGVCGTKGIDWNGDGDTDDVLSGNLDIDPATGQPYNPQLTVMSDYDDWAAIKSAQTVAAARQPRRVVACEMHIASWSPDVDIAAYLRTNDLVPVF